MTKEEITKICADIKLLLGDEATKSTFEAIEFVLSESKAEMKLPVKYIGKRNTQTDGLYGTGVYQKGETKLVPANIARKMLKHKDVYLDGNTVEAKSSVDVVGKETEQDTEQDIQNAIDSVMNMQNKNTIMEFAAKNFSNMTMDKRFTIDNLQQETIRMIHQYGLT